MDDDGDRDGVDSRAEAADVPENPLRPETPTWSRGCLAEANHSTLARFEYIRPYLALVVRNRMRGWCDECLCTW